MKKIFFIILFLTLSQAEISRAERASQSTRDSGPYAGVGFGFSQVTLTQENEAKSTFQGWNAVGEAGINLAFTDTFGFQASGEYKLTDVTNTMKSTTYMEKADFTQLNARAGFYWGAFTFGGGISKTSVDIKSVSSSSEGETKTFTGTPKLIFLNYGFEKGNMRAAIEGEYLTGTINNNIKYNDYSGGVRIYLLF
jgi:hypothetical protein